MKKKLYSVLSILMVLVFMFLAVASGSDTKTEKEDGNSKKETTTQKEEKPQYKIGDVVTIKTSTGDYKICFTGVKETKQRNEFHEERADRVILISYNVENVSYEDDLYVSDMSMKLYDKENNAMDTYPATEQKDVSAISKGRKTSGIIAYALNSQNNYVELEYYSNMFNSSADCKFVLEW